MGIKEPIPHVALGIVRDVDSVLLIERTKFETGSDGQVLSWAFPGGKLEPGEDQYDAVVRELAEETGYNVMPVEELDAWQHPSFPAYIHYVSCERIGDTPEQVADSGISQVKWVQISKLGLYVTHELNPAVQRFLLR